MDGKSDICPDCGDVMDLVWDAMGDVPYFKCPRCKKRYAPNV